MDQTCPKCHQEISWDDAFCSHCGVQLSQSIPISKAKKIKVYLLSFLLAPFGLYWFFKYAKSNDPEKKKVANRVVWITAAAIIFIVSSSILAANAYHKLLDTYLYGYGF